MSESWLGREAFVVQLLAGVVLNVMLFVPAPASAQDQFRRGDCNTDGTLDIADDIRLLMYLFAGSAPPDCLAACDFNGDDTLNIADAIYLESYLFSMGPAPPAPLSFCGSVRTGSAIACAEYDAPCPPFVSPFAPGITLTSYGSIDPVHESVFGDIDEDGILDLDLACAGGVFAACRELLWFRGLGGVEFGPAVPVEICSRTYHLGALSVGDLDGDGHLDLVTEQGTAFGSGAGSFVPLGAPAGGYPQAIVDLNSDGLVDIVAARPNGIGVRIALGAGAFAAEVIVTAPIQVGFGFRIAAADIDGDGASDIVTHGVNNIFAFLGDGFGGLSAPVISTPDGTFLTLADMNGDAFFDALLLPVFGSTPVISIFAGNGAGGFSPVIGVSSPQVVAGEMAVGDIDLDGDLDVVSAAFGGGVAVHLRDADGTFITVITVQVPFGAGLVPPLPFSVALADFDGDNDLDLVAGSWDLSGPGHVTVFENTTN